MTFRLSNKSINRLEGVHNDLAGVVQRAIELTPLDFGVTQGLRTAEEQEILYASGKSKTKNSRHLTGHAVDLAVYIGKEVNWDMPNYEIVADAMFKAADEQNIPIEWGGNWKFFKDGPHFQLPWEAYPI